MKGGGAHIHPLPHKKRTSKSPDLLRLSDYHKIISTFFKACSSKLKLKLFIIEVTKYLMIQISYAVSKKSQNAISNFDFFKHDPNQNYNLLTDKFLGIANKYAPLKKRFVRGHNAPFMN